MSLWNFQNPVEIRFGAGCVRTVGEMLPETGHLLVVTTVGGRRRPGIRALVDQWVPERVVIVDDVEPNPTLNRLEEQIGRLVDLDVRMVVAIGGGSVLDSAKVIAVSLADPRFNLRSHLRGEGKEPPVRRARLVCVPTTAGTGSEVTPFATVWDGEEKKKRSMSGPTVFPDLAVLDPELTRTVPVETTIMTGLDAVTQAFEAIWSKRRNAVSNAAAIRAIRLGLENLPKLTDCPEDIDLRTAMLECSLLAGLAISNSRTALCHSISYPLTMRLGIPHGLACGFVLPEVLSFNQEADPGLFQCVSQELGYASITELEVGVRQMLDQLDVGRLLEQYGLSIDGALECVPEMLSPGRADNNLRDASLDDVGVLVARAIRERLR